MLDLSLQTMSPKPTRGPRRDGCNTSTDVFTCPLPLPFSHFSFALPFPLALSFALSFALPFTLPFPFLFSLLLLVFPVTFPLPLPLRTGSNGSRDVSRMAYGRQLHKQTHHTRTRHRERWLIHVLSTGFLVRRISTFCNNFNDKIFPGATIQRSIMYVICSGVQLHQHHIVSYYKWDWSLFSSSKGKP